MGMVLFLSQPVPTPVSYTHLTLSEIAQTWDKMGLFASIVIYPQNIVYELAQNGTVRHFLSGKWLELFVEHQVQDVYKRQVLTLTGGATGLYCGYVDFIAWDIREAPVSYTHLAVICCRKPTCNPGGS